MGLYAVASPQQRRRESPQLQDQTGFRKPGQTAAWETSISGPFDRWPTRQGFDTFYGFIGGETNQWSPFIFDGLTQVEPEGGDDYHFMTDMTDQAITWLRHQQAMTPDRPFFVYFAPGAVHAPHHVPQAWIDRWKGRFDEGWDVLRERTLARQIEAGVVPPDTVLAPKPAAIRDWDALSTDEKRLFARQAEVFAAFTEHTDHEIGRMIRSIEDMGELENTLIFYIAGDNGTSAEGGENGMFNEYTYFNGVTEQVADMLPLIDKWGGPETYPHMAAGWAVALNAPFTWVKQVASSFGGTRVGMAVHWPAGIEAKGGLRSQFAHVIDIAPTILEAAGLPEPTVVNGTVQRPMDGISLLYAFDDADAPERRTTQYFEIAGNRAVYRDGWLAGTIHRAPWEAQSRRALADDVWELYDVRSDFSLANDLAAAAPEPGRRQTFGAARGPHRERLRKARASGDALAMGGDVVLGVARRRRQLPGPVAGAPSRRCLAPGPWPTPAPPTCARRSRAEMSVRAIATAIKPAILRWH